ncbi:TetR/AcrR family transcriptional regulator [Deinococcus apachensis]|uniref:TetR/AcrR family transcriptional regulator n=1 Tax=Deinococcus apachensis TaxID=309886 RepID=UPI0003811A8B|nr:TetR/AcrR family transcriptional regulator [Deinococcus apachensis]
MGDKRRLKRNERRSLILRSAADLFAEAGYRGVSLDEIAARAGVTKPVLYDHFSSKENLFAEVMGVIRADLLEVGRQALVPEGDVEERMRAALRAFFTYAGGHPQAMRVLLVTPRGEPALEALAASIQEEVTAALLALLLPLLPEAPDAAELRWRRLQVEFVKQGIHGLAEWWPSQAGLSGEELTEAVLRVIGPGLIGAPKSS